MIEILVVSTVVGWWFFFFSHDSLSDSWKFFADSFLFVGFFFVGFVAILVGHVG